MLRYQSVMAGLFVVLATAGLSTAARADIRDVVRNETNGTVVRSTDGECVRTRWLTDQDACASPQARYEEQKIVSLTREERTVYFGFNQASLSPQMKQRLDTIANAYRGNSMVKDARIVGYADRIGNPGYNERLSKKRAEAVRGYLVSHGLINTQVADTRWMGASDSVTDCPNNLKRPELITCLQKDRRVEVEIDLINNEQASR